MWCCCCNWCKDSKDEATLLTGADVDNVRKIYSFGRAGSRDDLDDSYQDLSAMDKTDGGALGRIIVTRVQPADLHDRGDYRSASGNYSPRTRKFLPPPSPDRVGIFEAKKRAPWHRTISPFRSKVSAAQSKASSLSQPLPVITVSSPDIVRDIKRNEVKARVQLNESPNLRHAGTVADVSSIKDLHSPTSWLKSQSMQDINSTTDLQEEEEEESAGDALARSYGLDRSLYPAQSHIGKSSEALDAWSPMQITNCKDCPRLQEQPSGTVHFTASFFPKCKKLYVHVHKLEGLIPKDDTYAFDVILKLSVIPLEKSSKVSGRYKASASTEVEEDFQFTLKDFVGKVLRISVYDPEHQGKYSAIGHALFFLEDVQAGNQRRYSMKLYKQSQPGVTPGSLQLTLSYQGVDEKLMVHVIQACNLMLGNISRNRAPDKFSTYAKVSLFCADQKVKSKKSAVVTNDRNPVYDHGFTFHLAGKNRDEIFVVVSVMLKGLLKKDMAIGRLILGSSCYAEGHILTPWGRAVLYEESVSHWFRMYM